MLANLSPRIFADASGVAVDYLFHMVCSFLPACVLILMLYIFYKKGKGR